MKKVQFEALPVGEKFTHEKRQWIKISRFAAAPVNGAGDSVNFENIMVVVKRSGSK